MEWEGKLEKHKYGCIPKHQEEFLEELHKKLRKLTPPTTEQETAMREEVKAQIKHKQGELGIIGNAGPKYLPG